MSEPTTGTEWRKPRAEGYVVPLPSGNLVRLRPVAIDRLILSGKIPDILTPIAAKSLWVESDTGKIGTDGELAKGFAELINIVIPAAVMEPKIVVNPQADDEIGLDDIDFADKVAIFQLASGGASVLKAFRDRQGGDVAALLDGQNNGQPTQQPDSGS